MLKIILDFTIQDNQVTMGPIQEKELEPLNFGEVYQVGNGNGGPCAVHVGPTEPTDANAYLWVKTAEEGGNLLNTAINEDGTPFVGLKNGHFDFYTGIFTESPEMEGYYYSGFIPVEVTDKLYFHGLPIDGMEYGIVLYDQDFQYIQTSYIWDLPYDEEGNEIGTDAAEFDDDGIVWLDIAKLISRDFYDAPKEELARVAYIRLQGIYDPAPDCAVTKSEGKPTGADNVLKIKNANGTWEDVTGAPELNSEEWTFALADGSTVTKEVVVG